MPMDFRTLLIIRKGWKKNWRRSAQLFFIQTDLCIFTKRIRYLKNPNNLVLKDLAVFTSHHLLFYLISLFILPGIGQHFWRNEEQYRGFLIISSILILIFFFFWLLFLAHDIFGYKRVVSIKVYLKNPRIATKTYRLHPLYFVLHSLHPNFSSIPPSVLLVRYRVIFFITFFFSHFHLYLAC